MDDIGIYQEQRGKDDLSHRFQQVRQATETWAGPLVR